MGDIAGFKAEFEREVLKIPGVRRVEFFGSIAKTTFIQGKSDLDVIVIGEVSPENKCRIAKLLEEVSKKYNLGLESAPYMHPTPFFVRGDKELRVFRELFDGHLHLVRVFEPLREELKARAPTYRDYWEGKPVREELRRITPLVDILFWMYG
ncbi:MAG: hypothetical protein DRI26_01135 [Chloroflexi bacterium]|nr:MAG: hypothetical protein DRI26_01135 [Chloroflexota bacterium]